MPLGKNIWGFIKASFDKKVKIMLADCAFTILLWMAYSIYASIAGYSLEVGVVFIAIIVIGFLVSLLMFFRVKDSNRDVPAEVRALFKKE